MIVEKLLRETFDRHEDLAPGPAAVSDRIAVLVRRRRRLRWYRRVTAVGVVIALAALAMTALPRGGAPAIGPADRAAAPSPAVTLLLIGLDVNARPDTIVLAHLPAGGGAAYLISIPRALTGLSAAYAAGGAAALTSSVSGRVGVAIDGVVEVEFAGLEKVTDAVGGVDLCVDVRVTSEHVGFDQAGKFRSPHDGGRPAVYHPGCRRFAGWEALDYLRQRKSLADGDAGRQRHARDYLKALLARLAGADLIRLMAVARAAGQALRIDLRGRPIADLVVLARDLRATDVVSIGAVSTDDRGEPTPAALEVFAALRDSSLGAWTAAHPA